MGMQKRCHRGGGKDGSLISITPSSLFDETDYKVI